MLAENYHSDIIDKIKADDFTYRSGRLTIHLAREFGFCYGVDRAVDYAYQTIERFPDRRVLLTGEIIHNPGVNARLRAKGPAGIQALLDLAASDPEAARSPAFSATLDAVCAQHDCAASHLYWYTDLTAARAEAERTGKPILSLRLLGRLDEELSCANSRFFRAVLYPDPQVASLLRDHFVLHWESVRPVPKVTVDFGDGRRLDSLESSFRRESGAEDPERAAQTVVSSGRWIGPRERPAWRASERALSKSIAEMPILLAVSPDAGSTRPPEITSSGVATLHRSDAHLSEESRRLLLAKAGTWMKIDDPRSAVWSFEGVIAEAARNGEFEKTRPEIAARGILGMVNWCYTWFHADGELSPREVAEILAAIVITGLERRDGASPAGTQ